jgi:hypothetical protein
MITSVNHDVILRTNNTLASQLRTLHYHPAGSVVI